MIARYETNEMKEIWSLENQYRSWEIVELAVCHAWAKDGVIPPEAMKKIDERFHPDGFNIGVNIGEAAGQSVFHCHMHIIPRFKGDVPSPKGGIRGVIPQKQNYIIKKNKNHLDK